MSTSLRAFVPVVTGAEVIAARLPMGPPQTGGILDLTKGGVNWSFSNTTNTEAPQSGKNLNLRSGVYLLPKPLYSICSVLPNWNVQWRRDCTAKVGLGFTLPTEDEQPLMDKSGQVLKEEVQEEVVA